MSGTLAGGENMRITMIARFGSEEAWREYMKENGRKGGSAKVPKGFATMDKDRVRAAGHIGGLHSSRLGVRNREGKYGN